MTLTTLQQAAYGRYEPLTADMARNPAAHVTGVKRYMKRYMKRHARYMKRGA